MTALDAALQADLERRFGGLRRLFGDAGYARLRAARVAVFADGRTTVAPRCARTV